MYDDLSGKTALISGGARGQGASHARTLADLGVNIVLTDLRDELGEKVAQEIRNGGRNAVYVHADVRQTDDWSQAVDRAQGEFGALHILVNNAGIVQCAPIETCSDDEWDGVIATNLTGTFKGMRAVVPALRAAGGGAIVNISSVFGVKGTWGYAGYVASKAAVAGVTKSAALTYAADNIRVNAIAPSSVDTPMIDEEKKIWADNPYFDFDEWMAAQPIPRIAQPAEVSDLVTYLVSDHSRYCTGGLYPIDGGILAG
ncbi:3-oxoacyl-[acyl-carrier-protein] reductase [Rhodococcus opacus PD630]|uniref:SDR family NAD(P)-dependent oxidoreductase n=1 Tax=Rhodococcus opacus TaxID=37919 RepID=UPI00029CCD01|nr:SDR family NAD(P)-dependent oxidoreductase [Rhodococcus opacus]EHI43679.1 3-oxoacyl-[acyl-carrier-protein] reductase [Rhodococcus opacus PD630]UDH01201.1 SDR family oxidoreductase [Rhodococcus opacus PD630]